MKIKNDSETTGVWGVTLEVDKETLPPSFGILKDLLDEDTYDVKCAE